MRAQRLDRYELDATMEQALELGGDLDEPVGALLAGQELDQEIDVYRNR